MFWQRSRDQHPSARQLHPSVHRSTPVAATPTTRSQARRRRPAEMQRSLEQLDAALQELSDYARDASSPAYRLLNPLLDVWDAAKAVDPEVSEPVEVLLTAAIHRASLESEELIDCIHQVRALALQESVLAGANRG